MNKQMACSWSTLSVCKVEGESLDLQRSTAVTCPLQATLHEDTDMLEVNKRWKRDCANTNYEAARARMIVSHKADFRQGTLRWVRKDTA